MSLTTIKEITEATTTRIADCPLSRLVKDKMFVASVSEYDKPLGSVCEERKVCSANGRFTHWGDIGKEAVPEKESPRIIYGGSYKDVYIVGEGEMYEIHHMPPDSVSHLERNDGPSIKMEKGDHWRTASWGMSQDAREYREMQSNLIKDGKFKEALQMDIDDIHEKFGNKYDAAIGEMYEYVGILEQEGRI